MITRLALTHWKSHYDSVLEFEHGTNIIVGQMGSGKTSITDAISFALFGTYPALQNRRVTLDETLMQKPTPQDHARVKLTFTHDGRTYTVERALFRDNKTNQAKLYRDESLIAGPKQSEVTAEVEKLLGVDYDLFSRAVYSEQNQIDYFLRLSPRERKEKFDELLQIHRYENARTSAVQLSNRVKKNAADQQRFADEQEKNLSGKRIEELEEKITSKEKQREEIAAQKTRLSAEYDLRKEALRELEGAEKTHRELETRRIRNESERQSLRKQLSRMKERVATGAPTRDAHQLRQLTADADEKRVTLENTRKQLQQQLLSHTQSTGGYAAQLSQAEKTLSQILATDGHCPFCKRPLDEHDKRKFETETQQAKQEIEIRMQSERAAQEKTRAALSDTDHALERIRMECKTLSEETLRVEQASRDAADMARTEKQLAELEEQANDILAQQEKHPFDEKALRTLRDEATQAQARLQSAQQQEKSLAEMTHELKKQLAELSALRQSVQKIRDQAAADAHAAEQLSLFTNCLEATQGQLREHLLDAVNAALSDLWPRVYPYQDYTTCRIQVEEGSYELFVRTRHGTWMRVEGQLSGGERSATAICIRLAFALVLTQSLGWIILDEPTHNLDERGVKELAGLLKEHLPQLVDQIFIITHDPVLEHAATGTLHRIERDKENDGVSKPVAMQVFRSD